MTKIPKFVLTRGFDFGFSIGLPAKHVRLCLEESDALGVPMIVGGAVRQPLTVAKSDLGADADLTGSCRSEGRPMTGDVLQPSAAGLSRRPAAFVHRSRWADIPEPVRAHAMKAVFNGFGTALGGSSDQAVLRLTKSFAPFSGHLSIKKRWWSHDACSASLRRSTRIAS